MTEQQTLAQADEYIRAAERLAEAARQAHADLEHETPGHPCAESGYVCELQRAIWAFERVQAGQK